MIVYFNGEFMPKNAVKISPDDRGFLLGDGAYEVMRSYNGFLFKAREHILRMDSSLENLRLRNPFKGDIKDIGEKLLRDNRLQDTDATFYVQVTRGAAPRQFAFPGEEVSPTVYAAVSAFEPAPNKHKRDRGVKIVLEPDIRWGRCDIKAMACSPVFLQASEQKNNKRRKPCSFVTGSLPKDRTLALAQFLETNFLPTRTQMIFCRESPSRWLLEICNNLGISVNRTPIFVDQIKEADELILMGTTMEVVPVVQVDDWKVGDGTPGPITKKLQREYSKLTLK